MLELYTYKPHSWWQPKKRKWCVYCWKCGLLRLNNEITQQAIKLGCNYEDHPRFNA